MGLRHQKVNAALKREISRILQEEIKDSRLGFVTIMRVELTPDLRYARVYFSVLGSEKEQKLAVEVLKHATPFIRSLLADKINLRFVPELIFKFDQSIEYSIKIQKELDRLEEERKARGSEK